MVLPLVLGLGLLALIVMVGLPWQLHLVALAWSDRRVASLAEVVAESTKSGLDFGDADFVERRLDTLRSSPDARYAVVMDSADAVFARWGAVPDDLPPRPRWEVAATEVGRGEGQLVVQVPIEAKGGARGRLVVGFATDAIDAAWSHDRSVGMLIAAGLWTIGLALAWGYGSMLVRPLTRLTAVAAGSDAAGLAVAAQGMLPARPYVRDERMVLTQAFASMAARLAAQVAALDAERGRALVAEEEAVRSNSAKSTFLANMSHELRTPLNAIIGYAELCLEIEESPEVSRDIARIHTSAKHLLALINDILDLAKVEAGRMQFVPERIRVAKLVDEVVASVQPLVEKNRNRLQVDVADDAGEMTTDPLRLRQCLFNLLSNAAKFTDAGRIGLRVVRGGGTITFSVDDTGAGMNAEQLALLFRPFTQLDMAPTRRYGGTGLGLALTRLLATAMGGEVTVRSTPAVGSTFTLRLPADAVTTSFTSTAAPHPRDGATSHGVL